MTPLTFILAAIASVLFIIGPYPFNDTTRGRRAWYLSLAILTTIVIVEIVQGSLAAL